MVGQRGSAATAHPKLREAWHRDTTDTAGRRKRSEASLASCEDLVASPRTRPAVLGVPLSFREARRPTRDETNGACGLRSSFCISRSVDRCDYVSFRQRICMSRTRRARRFGCGVGFVRRSPADTSETCKRVGKPLASTRICRICRWTETRRESVAPCGLA